MKQTQFEIATKLSLDFSTYESICKVSTSIWGIWQHDNMDMCPLALYESLTSIQNERHIKKYLATHSAFMPFGFLEEKQRFLN